MLGTPDNPMTAAQVEAKACDLIAPHLGAGQTEALIGVVREIEAVADVRDLRPLLMKR